MIRYNVGANIHTHFLDDVMFPQSRYIADAIGKNVSPIKSDVTTNIYDIVYSIRIIVVVPIRIKFENIIKELNVE
jgi:hypothetical protein